MIGSLAGLVSFAVVFVERLNGTGSEALSEFLLAYSLLSAVVGLPFSVVIVLGIVQLQLEGGLIGYLIKRRKPIACALIAAAHGFAWAGLKLML